MIEKREIAYGVNLRCVNEKQTYIKNLINGRYFLARYNMMAQQIIDKKIVELIDGAPKSQDLMVAETALMKMQAINSMRTAHFAKKELQEEFKLLDKDILELESDYYNGKIVRVEYDEGYKKGNKAEFVNTSED